MGLLRTRDGRLATTASDPSEVLSAGESAQLNYHPTAIKSRRAQEFQDAWEAQQKHIHEIGLVAWEAERYTALMSR